MSRHDTAPEVTIPRQPAGTFFALHDCRRPHGDALVVFTVRAEAPGLAATIGIETLHGDGLADFVHALDQDFRGWTGDRIWTSLRGDLQLRATHHGAVITMAWTLRFPEPAEQDPGIWETTVRVNLNPGEDLRTFSSDLTAFMDV